MRADRLITLKGFLNQVLEQHQRRKDRPFCFILGAGASRASGIPTGAEMAREWLQEIHEAEDFTGATLEGWASTETLGIPDFDINNLGHHYPEIYWQRYSDNQEAGYAFLENKMQAKEPSFGYSVLAHLLSETPHKIVITTNFDNLVADALSIHSTTFPIVVGHDALASYAKVDLRRPLIAKVHGGLGFAPKSTREELKTLSDSWRQSLHKIFQSYSPIVIGYDGNDGSLMGFLEGLDDDAIDGLYWCFYSPGGQTSPEVRHVPERVKALVQAKRGRLVPIPGFDELMLLLRDHLGPIIGMPDLLEKMRERARTREAAYDEQQRSLAEKLKMPTAQTRSGADQTKKLTSDPNVDKMLAHAMAGLARDRKDKPWWMWVMEAHAADSITEKQRVYEKAIEALLPNAELLGGYALFLENERKETDKAEEFYKRAIDADPKHANNLGNYAVFLKNERKDMGKAEEFYKRAVDADPKHANNLGNYAVFLEKERKDMGKAEEFYKRAVDADPKHANNLGNYAVFLEKERKETDKAEELYKRAIDADPKRANNLGNYAVFLKNERKETDKAEEFFKRAIDANPKDANTLGSYAVFLQNERKDLDKAEEFYKRAVEADPKNANNVVNYAQCCFLRNENQVGTRLLEEAANLSPTAADVLVELAFYRLAHTPEAWPEELLEMHRLLHGGARSLGWPLLENVRVAREAGHPNPELLTVIAEVISCNAPLSSLTKYPEWPQD